MNNIESTFRDKSKMLRVEPSEAAWERLEPRLSAIPPKEFQFKNWLMAASITGMVIMGTLFLVVKNDPKSSLQYQTTSLDFTIHDYSDAASKISTLRNAYIKLEAGIE